MPTVSQKFGLNKNWILVLLASLAAQFCLVLYIFQEALTRIPNTGDEHSLLFQAQVFSHLRLAAPPPPLPDFFICHYVHVWNGKWFGICPPFGSLVRVLGEWAGSQQILAALLSVGCSVLLFWFLLRTCKNIWVAYGSTLLLALSPAFLFHSASYYTQVPSFGFFLISLLAMVRFQEAPSRGSAACVGLALAAGALVRPYTFFLLFFPCVTFLVCQARPKRRLETLFFCGLPLAGAAILFCAYSYALTGRPTLVPSDHVREFFGWAKLSADGVKSLVRRGFQSLRWFFPLGRIESGNLEESDGTCALGAVVLIASSLYETVKSHREHHPRRYWDLLLVSCALVLFFGHLPYQGIVGGRFGERYFFEVLFIPGYFLVRFLSRVLQPPGASFRSRIALAMCMVGLCLPGFTYLPGTIEGVRNQNRERFDLYLQIEHLGLRNALVFVKEVPYTDPPFYARNHPWLDGNIFVVDRGAENVALATRFPDRPSYVYRTGASGYLVLEKAEF